ncbi:hypothetical protein HYX05_04790 [Candidatus Woesearchaeota archaeon]|nr:hypothetical protein [Candidatus Woesearchaeota archaeon]
MKLGDILFKVLVFTIVLLIISTISLYQILNKKLALLKQDSKVLEENFKALKKNYELLVRENQELRDSNAKLKQESISLSSTMKSTKLEVEQTIEKLNDFETIVKNSIQWFKENANIGNFSDYGKIKEQLNKCIEFKDNCEIDLKCIYKINKENNIRYTDDESAIGKQDFLKDLKLIHQQYGGDCEDFSLLYKAEFNYLLDKCMVNYTREQIYSIAFEPKTEKLLKIDKDYMYIICGTFDPKEVIGNVAGHCLNALTKKPIKSSSDIYRQIVESVMVEPQIGEFYGYMNSTDHINIFNDNSVPDTLYYIDFVITDDDLYIYDSYAEKVEWKGYHDFLEESNQIKGSMGK